MKLFKGIRSKVGAKLKDAGFNCSKIVLLDFQIPN